MPHRHLAPTTSLLAVMLLLGLARGAAAQEPVQPPTYPLLSTPDHLLALVKAAEERLPYVPGEVLVKFREGLTPIDQQRALSALRSKPGVETLTWVGDVAMLRDASEPDSTVLAARLAQQPEVEYAEPNALYRHTTTPNDPSFTSRQWNFTAIGVDRAWDINPGASKSVVVAVVDFGITTVTNNYTFPTWDGRAITNTSVAYRVNPDLSSARLLEGRDFAFWGGPVLDMDGHGTHVSSTIGEDTNNGLAEAGIAYNATILPVKACLGYWDIQFSLSALGIRGYAPLDSGGCTASAVASAIRYAADNGASVINMSLGGPSPSTTVRDAMTYAVQHGSLVTVAMGNEYEEGNPTDYPAGYAGQIDGAIAVSAVGRSLKRAYYSNTGAHNELAAPGGDVRDGGLAGTIWQSGVNPTDFDPVSVIFPRFDRYVELPEQGTSMAAPHVAGIAALVFSQGVKDPAAIEKLLEATAQDLGATGRDNEFGYGLVQPRAALRGFGIAR